MADIIQDSDQFLVNRSDTTQTVTKENLMATIEDTDLMIVNRGGTTYTVTGEDVKDSLGGKPIYPEPDEITSSPSFQGGTGTEVDPFLLQTIEVRPAGSSGISVEEITIAVPGATEGDLVSWTDNSTGAGNRFAQPTGVVGADGTWSGKLVYTDTPDTAVDADYTGNLQIGDAYFRWIVEQKVSLVEPISFTPTITGNNKVGDVLTANAGAITGGVAPVEYAFQWKRDGSDISLATAKTYTLVSDDVGQTISCDVTCAEPDGSAAVTETAVYDQTPVAPDRAPVVGSVNLVESNPDTAPRFTDQSFVTTVLMTDQGVPQSTKEFQAKVEGTVTTNPLTDPIETATPTTVSGPWTANPAVTAPGGNNLSLRSVAYGNGKFVAIGAKVSDTGFIPGIAISTDGMSWEYPSGLNGLGVADFNSIAFDGEVFVVVGYQPESGSATIYKSTDGINWSKPSLSNPGGSFFLVVARPADPDTGRTSVFALFEENNGRAYYSTDHGDTWTFMNVPTGQYYYNAGTWGDPSAAGTNGRLCVLGRGNAIYSDDGITWAVAQNTNVGGYLWLGLTYGNGTYLGVTEYNQILTSPDGLTWTLSNVQTASSSAKWWDVKYGNELFVLVGEQAGGAGLFASTPDVANWSVSNAPGPKSSQQRVVEYGNNLFSSINPGISGQDNYYSTTGGFDINITALTFATNKDLDKFASGDSCSTDSGTNTGTVYAVNSAAKSMDVKVSSGSFEVGEIVKGPQIITTNTTKYLEFNAAGTVSSLRDTPMDPPVSIPDESPQLTLTFPSTFPSGQTPDDELGDGTTLTVDVKAVSGAFESEQSSNTVQPSASAPLPPGTLSGQATLYAGTNSDQSVVTGIDLVNNDGMLLIKNYTSSANPVIVNTIRGSNKTLYTNRTEKENDKPTWVKSFNTNGFTVGGGSVAVNTSPDDFVAWTFTVSPGYFDIVTWSGLDGYTDVTVPHSLGSTPGFIIAKSLNTGDWTVYHKDAGVNYWGKLNSTGLFTDTGSDKWSPSDTSFNASKSLSLAKTGEDYVGYLFADTEGLIKCGSYTGNGGNPHVIETGFEPGFLILKAISGSASGAEQWFTYSTADNFSKEVCLNLNNKASPAYVSTTPNGFSINAADAPSYNKVGAKYIYIAIAAPVVRSLTEAEFAQQRLNFETYQNRKEVKEGEEAKAARAALIAQLREQGYTDAQIDAEFGL